MDKHRNAPALKPRTVERIQRGYGWRACCAEAKHTVGVIRRDQAPARAYLASLRDRSSREE